ncbi:MAG TPA: hypothetical protein VME24_03875, partial [Alphaproteobacteria bacterium]|nr:hypothetical protein [Alphaproteobacteria bacterium]
PKTSNRGLGSLYVTFVPLSAKTPDIDFLKIFKASGRKCPSLLSGAWNWIFKVRCPETDKMDQLKSYYCTLRRHLNKITLLNIGVTISFHDILLFLTFFIAVREQFKLYSPRWSINHRSSACYLKNNH